MLDEKALRKASWEEASGEWVELSEGQRWLLPKPWVKRTPSRINGVLVMGSKTEFGPEFDAMIKSTDDDFLNGIFSMVTFLLMRNYELTEEQTLELIEIDSRNLSDFYKQIFDIALGNSAPKA